ncbi:MAG: hypothetical protein M1305_01390, partial [Candidatus Marsarchaeota archaeon]|nr:hypothetical protein [Candidatus Marsarchaeota archaeon]
RERRSLDNREEILNLFQGAHPDKSGSIYPGDRYVRTLTRVTIQIHDLTLVRKGAGGLREVVSENVPVVAIWVPGRMGNPSIVQDESGLRV